MQETRNIVDRKGVLLFACHGFMVCWVMTMPQIVWSRGMVLEYIGLQFDQAHVRPPGKYLSIDGLGRGFWVLQGLNTYS